MQETILKEDFSAAKLPRKTFENVVFDACKFKQLNDLIFIDCTFSNCDLSNVKLVNTKLQDVEFNACKLVGADFSPVKPFAFCVVFVDCTLDYASFDKLKLNKSSFKQCRLKAVNFAESDCSKVEFDGCDFAEAVFDQSDLRGVDFTTSYNFTIDPEQNKLFKAKFQSNDLAGLLTKYQLEIF